MPETEPKIVGMHVRIPETHILFAKLAARSQDLTLAGYIDHLIVSDAERQQDLIPEILQDLDNQIDELTLARQSLVNLLDNK